MTTEEVGFFAYAQNDDAESACYTRMERLLIKC